ncbi:metallopeptidase family protein [Sphingomonas astaxanthinifaciens]|uniref:Acetylglutamate kinase n=1 Tax=Sphingomonas astaxanthinifaciens DSM 22298 TaxID=1123267 RepID=A0ABQ5Z8L9_9SPHN|nr:metallopeptidase family protein [Sphingomonas astaxanthinifaciens]GLR47922.1 acetylglutamate kinase [Sphingomonas astaxanthinifaciens DSM 22298]
MRAFGPAPSFEEIEAIARQSLDRLPEPFAATAREIVLRIEEFAEEEILAEMGIEDPYDLTGLYVGRPLTERSVDESGRFPDQVFLYRAPILLEWMEGEDSLEHLVAHVLIHEIGHHFGLSDEDMHALEEAAEHE